MTRTHKTHRIAIVALSASLVLPIAPVFGQNAQPAPVVVAPPSPVVVAPPPPVTVTPPPPVAVTPPPVARTAPPPAPAARETRTATRAARPAPRARVAAPEAAPAPAAAPTPAPVAEAPLLPIEAAPLAAPPPALTEAPISAIGTATPRGSTLPWLIAGLALFAGLVGFALWRRRRSREEASEVYYEEQPAYVEEPVMAEAADYQPAIVAPLPSFRREQPAFAAEVDVAVESDIEEVNEVETNAADVEALGAADTTHRNRPWLEMLMRPIRAGANGEDTVVEFSLTVGNTGGVPAEDVRISAWMLGTQGSEAEGLLIDPPAGATLSETRIEAGDGATLEATVSMPRETFDRAMLPIVVTDARYRLPGGGEGRTSACFAVGLPIGDELVPFPANAASGLNESVEARVHCEVEHV